MTPASLQIAVRLARRELRAGLQGFRIFLACLALGVAAIAAVGSCAMPPLRPAYVPRRCSPFGRRCRDGLSPTAFATEAEKATGWPTTANLPSPKIVDFRSMAVVERGDEAERALTQVKGVDAAYPLIWVRLRC